MIRGEEQPQARRVIDETAQRLVRQLDRSLGGHKASGEAFVASVYGEWGVGKTHCLKSVQEIYSRRLRVALAEGVGGQAEPPAVPIWFDPWRYEHEEHLAVPLLKTIEHGLAQVAVLVQEAVARHQGRDEFIERNRDFGLALQRGGVTLGRLAQALLSAMKFKAFGLDVDPEKAIKASRELAMEAQAEAEAAKGSALSWWHPGWWSGRRPQGAVAAQESLYYDAQTQLLALTEPTAGFKLRIVVLVDDLDRCLPEKAIQVLESIKLFLNVAGFSFVLAVDDEVVERGIAYRYKDYRLTDKSGVFIEDMPISGTQYLEKIVHLPMHLPRWTVSKARAFLVQRYPQLYAQPPSRDAAPETTAEGRPADKAVESAPGAGKTQSLEAELLDLVLNAVPLVPRKLIRLSEGVEFLRDQFAERGQSARWSPLHGLRVVALQQLHPALYRHVRQRPSRYWRLFNIMRDDWGEPRYRDGEGLSKLKFAFDQRQSVVKTGDSPTSAAESQAIDTAREKLDLLSKVHTSGDQRGAGDPVDWFKLASGAAVLEVKDLGLEYQSFADLYFAGEATPTVPLRTESASAARQPPEARIAESEFESAVAALLSPDAVSRREFIEQRALDGTRLPSGAMSRLLGALEADDPQTQALALDKTWLRDLAGVMSADQLLALYARARVIEGWVNGVPEEWRT